jgi:soluble lytic murein transglycosylase
MKKPYSAPDKDACATVSSMTNHLTSVIAIRLLAGAALMTPFSAIAQDLMAPPPPRSFVAPSNAGLAETIAQWKAIRQSESLPFWSYADFLTRHPGWPGEAALRKTAERQLRPDSVSPTQVIAYFARYPAQSPSALLRYAEALDSTGQRDTAREMARRAWTTGSLSIDDETRLTRTSAPTGCYGHARPRMRRGRFRWPRRSASRCSTRGSPCRRARPTPLRRCN